MAEGKQMQCAEKDFTCQNPINISTYSYFRNSKKNKENSCQDSDTVMDKASHITSKPVKNTGKSSIGVKERTNKGHGTYINAGSRTVKKKTPKPGSEKEKKCCAYYAKKKSSVTCFFSNGPYSCFVAQRLHFCNRRHQHDRSGICYSGRKKNQGQSHSGKNPINTESV